MKYKHRVSPLLPFWGETQTKALLVLSYTISSLDGVKETYKRPISIK